MYFKDEYTELIPKYEKLCKENPEEAVTYLVKNSNLKAIEGLKQIYNGLHQEIQFGKNLGDYTKELTGIEKALEIIENKK